MVNFEDLSFRLGSPNFLDLSEKLTEKPSYSLIFFNEFNNLASVK